MVSVNTAGPVGTGRSLVVDPEGRVRAEAPDSAATVLTDVLDLDDVTRVRTFGTAGLNRMWDQFTDADTPIDLPLYGGRIDPAAGAPPPAEPARPLVRPPELLMEPVMEPAMEPLMENAPAQGLTRALTLRSVVLFGLAYMTPLIVLGTFGVVAESTGGTVPTAYLLALLAMLFTAHSYGKMAAAHPVAGSAYTYVRRAIDCRVGFLIGWATLLDYFFLPMVIWLIGGAYLQAQFPRRPVLGVDHRLHRADHRPERAGASRQPAANDLFMTFQVLVIGIFVALSLRHVLHVGGARCQPNG
ncbi:amino acid permease [Streptomyces canarius]